MTLHVGAGKAAGVVAAAVQAGANLRLMDDSHVSIALDETNTLADIDLLLGVLAQVRAREGHSPPTREISRADGKQLCCRF